MKNQYKLLLAGLLLTTAFAADSEYEFDGDEKNPQAAQEDWVAKEKRDLGIKQAFSEYIPENEENARPDPMSIVIKPDPQNDIDADEVIPVVQPEVTPLSDEQEARYADESERQRRAIDAQMAADIQEYHDQKKINGDVTPEVTPTIESEVTPTENPTSEISSVVGSNTDSSVDSGFGHVDSDIVPAPIAAGDPAPVVDPAGEDRIGGNPPAAGAPVVDTPKARPVAKLEAKSQWSNTIKLTPGVAINKDSAAYVIIGAEFRDTKLTYSKGSEVSRSSQLTIRPVVGVGCRTALSPNTFLKAEYTAIPEKTFRKSDATTKLPATHSVSVGLNFKF